jgi:hypothetical protein
MYPKECSSDLKSHGETKESIEADQGKGKLVLPSIINDELINN